MNNRRLTFTPVFAAVLAGSALLGACCGGGADSDSSLTTTHA
jgi:hypothetical protein